MSPIRFLRTILFGGTVILSSALWLVGCESSVSPVTTTTKPPTTTTTTTTTTVPTAQDNSILGTYDAWTYTTATGWLKVSGNQLVLSSTSLKMAGTTLFPSSTGLSDQVLSIQNGQIWLTGSASGQTVTVYLLDYRLQDATTYGTPILWLKVDATSSASLTTAPAPETANQNQILCYIPVGKTPTVPGTTTTTTTLPGTTTTTTTTVATSALYTKDTGFLGTCNGTLTVSRSNVVYSADYIGQNGELLSYTTAGTPLATVKSIPESDFGLGVLTTDGNGNLYSFDGQICVSVRKPDGTLVRRYGQDLLIFKGIAVDGQGNVFATGKNNIIYKFSRNGEIVKTFGGTGVTVGKFNITTSSLANVLVVDSKSNLFVLDTENRRIQKFDNDGNFLLSIPLATKSYSLLIDSTDTLFTYDNSLRQIDTSGAVISTFTPEDSGLYAAFDLAGNLYVGNTSVIYKYNRTTPLNVPAATAIALIPSTLALTAGDSGSILALQTTPANTSTIVTWTSTSAAVASVSTTGVVTALVPGTTTVKAATAQGLTATTAVTVSAVPAPVFSPAGGIQSDSSVKVTLSDASPTATLRYTTDGTDPTATKGSIFYSAQEITLYSTTTIKAIAVNNGVASAISSATYTFPTSVNLGSAVVTPPLYSVAIVGPGAVQRTSPAATFTGSYNGTATTYQWYIDGSAISGATAATLNLDVTNPSLSGGQHLLTLVITDTAGVAYSGKVTFTVRN